MVKFSGIFCIVGFVCLIENNGVSRGVVVEGVIEGGATITKVVL